VVGSANESQMVNPGGKVSYAIVVVSVGGSYNNPVALTATGLPAGATATFSPASATPGDNSAASILTIQMPAIAAKSSFFAPVSLPRNPLGPLPLISFGVALSLFAISRRMKFAVRGRQVAVWAMTCVLVAVALAGVSGCRGGFIASTPQSFAIVVTGTSGAQSHSTTVMLNIR